MLNFTQWLILWLWPRWIGGLTKFFYWGSRVKIGKNFMANSIPRLIVDPKCSLEIGDNVVFQRHVEIRVHGTAKVVIGDQVKLDRGVRILAANRSEILLKEGVRIGLYSVLNGGDAISVGKKTLISGFCYLQTSQHEFKNPDSFIQDQGYRHAPIVLEDNTWLGTHAVIMPGVTLATGTIVGSNAVVTKSSSAHAILVGIPAAPMKSGQDRTY